MSIHGHLGGRSEFAADYDKLAGPVNNDRLGEVAEGEQSGGLEQIPAADNVRHRDRRAGRENNVIGDNEGQAAITRRRPKPFRNHFRGVAGEISNIDIGQHGLRAEHIAILEQADGSSIEPASSSMRAVKIADSCVCVCVNMRFLQVVTDRIWELRFSPGPSRSRAIDIPMSIMNHLQLYK